MARVRINVIFYLSKSLLTYCSFSKNIPALISQAVLQVLAIKDTILSHPDINLSIFQRSAYFPITFALGKRPQSVKKQDYEGLSNDPKLDNGFEETTKIQKKAIHC